MFALSFTFNAKSAKQNQGKKEKKDLPFFLSRARVFEQAVNSWSVNDRKLVSNVFFFFEINTSYKISNP